MAVQSPVGDVKKTVPNYSVQAKYIDAQTKYFSWRHLSVRPIHPVFLAIVKVKAKVRKFQFKSGKIEIWKKSRGHSKL